MQSKDRQNRPYQLLGQMSPGTSPQGLPTTDLSGDQNPQELTTTYITTLYYCALTNLYIQSALPDTLDELDAENPRLKIALDRSFADFTAAQKWLDKHSDLIVSSTAKHYYDEISDMENDVVMDSSLFYSQSHN